MNQIFYELKQFRKECKGRKGDTLLLNVLTYVYNHRHEFPITNNLNCISPTTDRYKIRNLKQQLKNIMNQVSHISVDNFRIKILQMPLPYTVKSPWNPIQLHKDFVEFMDVVRESYRRVICWTSVDYPVYTFETSANGTFKIKQFANVAISDTVVSNVETGKYIGRIGVNVFKDKNQAIEAAAQHVLGQVDTVTQNCLKCIKKLQET